MSDLLFFSGCLLCGLALFAGLFAAGLAVTEAGEQIRNSFRPSPGSGTWDWLRVFRPLHRRRPFRALQDRLQARLARAGWEGGAMEGPEVLVLKEAAMVLTIILVWTVFGRHLLAIGLLASLAFFIPDLIIQDRIRQRQRRLIRDLPPFLDMLVLVMEAGLDLVQALDLVCGRGRGPVHQEFGKALNRIRLGSSRGAALREMAQSLDLLPFHTLVASVLQADVTGASLAPVFRIQADLMRKDRSQRAEKLAHEAPVKMLAPLMIFIFPVLFIILFGPLALEYWGR